MKQDYLLKNGVVWQNENSIYENFKNLYEIAKYNKEKINAEMLGKIASILVLIEKSPGGPYYRKIPKNGEPDILDIKTNKMIDSFLSLYGIHLPSLRRYIGNERITTITKNKMQRKEKVNFSKGEKEVMQNIRGFFQNRLSLLPLEFRNSAEEIFEATIEGNPDKQMPLIAYYFYQSIGELRNKINKGLVYKLGMMNIFFWSAFIVYDDFWDEDEKQNPSFLPVANMFARDFVDFFSTYFLEEKEMKSDFKREFMQVMDSLDSANHWEIKNCRAKIVENIFHIPKTLPEYKDYSKKYEPASGHILGPLLMLYEIGEERYAKDLKDFFKHLLIAMQLNDDMHDIEEDLKRGHISTTVSAILETLPSEKRTINLEKELGEIRKIFWFKVLPKLSEKVIYHTSEATKAIERIKIIKNPSPLECLINIQKNIGREAITKHRNSVAFLKGYGSKGIHLP